MVDQVGSVIGTSIAVGVAVGIDNMRASAGIGALAPRPSHARWLAALVLFDAVAIVAGATLGALIPEPLTDVAAVLGIAALLVLATVALLGWNDDRLDVLLSARAAWLGLPALLSLDNVAAGAALIAVGFPFLPTIPIVIGVAAALCAMGLVVGRRIHRLPRLSGQRLGGVLLAIAALVAIQDLS